MALIEINPKYRIWVGGLHPETNESEFLVAFQQFGIVKEFNFVVGRHFAFVTYADRTSFDLALDAHGTLQVHGVPMQILRPKTYSPPDEEGPPDCTVYVGNLDSRIRNTDLADHFLDCGRVVKVFMHKGTYAFVQFETNAGAQNALEMDKSELMGRPLRIREPISGRSAIRAGPGSGSDSNEVDYDGSDRVTLHLTNFLEHATEALVEETVHRAIPDNSVISIHCDMPKWAFITFTSFRVAEQAMGILKRTNFGGRIPRVSFSRNSNDRDVEPPLDAAAKNAENLRRTMFIRNLHPDVTEADLWNKFDQYGDVARVNFVRRSVDESKRQSSKRAFVRFMERRDMLDTVRVCNRMRWRGKLMYVNPAKPMKSGRSPRSAPGSAPSHHRMPPRAASQDRHQQHVSLRHHPPGPIRLPDAAVSRPSLYSDPVSPDGSLRQSGIWLPQREPQLSPTHGPQQSGSDRYSSLASFLPSPRDGSFSQRSNAEPASLSHSHSVFNTTPLSPTEHERRSINGHSLPQRHNGPPGDHERRNDHGLAHRNGSRSRTNHYSPTSQPDYSGLAQHYNVRP